MVSGTDELNHFKDVMFSKTDEQNSCLLFLKNKLYIVRVMKHKIGFNFILFFQIFFWVNSH